MTAPAEKRWTCSVCEHVNFQRAVRCANCSAPPTMPPDRPSPAPTPKGDDEKVKIVRSGLTGTVWAVLADGTQHDVTSDVLTIAARLMKEAEVD